MTALSISFGPSTALPLDVLLSMIPSLPRAALDRLTERMIDRMDEIDGDADIEPNGDDLDGAEIEDEFYSWRDSDPGDPADAEDDTEDCYPAGDDYPHAGLSPLSQMGAVRPEWIGDDVDAETNDLTN